MNKEDLNSKVVKGIFHNISGNVAKNIVSFLFSIILSRILAPSDFGLAGIALVLISLIQGFSDLGLTSGLIHSRENSQSQLSSVFFFNLFVSFFLTFVLFFSSGFIAKFYNNVNFQVVIQAVSFLFILNSLNNVHSSILYKNLEIKYTRISSVLAAIISGIVGVGLAFNNYGVWSLVISSYASAITSVCVIWYHSKWRPSFIFNFSEIKKIMPFGIKVFTTNYIDQMYSRLDVLIIGKFFDPITLGYYFRSSSLAQLVAKYSSQGLSGIFFPAINFMRDDILEIRKFYQKVINVICFVSFLIIGFLFTNANEIILLLYGEKWFRSVEYFEILVFSCYVTPLTIIFNGILLGKGNPSIQLKLEVAKKFISIFGILVSIRFGILSFLSGLIITETLGLFLSFVYINRIIQVGVKKNIVYVFKHTIPLFIALSIVYLFKSFQITISPILFLIINSFIYISVYIFITRIFRYTGYEIISNMCMRLFSKIRFS